MDGRPLPSVESLRCFVAAAEQLSFRRAAAEVALTPAAFSQRIKQLEELLDTRLFDRSSRHVALTTDGQVLLERARTALAQLRGCLDVHGAGDRRVELSLATRFELGLSWIVPTIVELRSTRPRWHIDLVFGSSDEVLDRLESGRVDAVVTSTPTASADWAAEVLHPEHYALVGHPEHLARVPFDRPADAAAHVLVDVDGDLPLARYLVSVCPGLAFAQVWRAGTGAAVHELVRAGLGVAVLPEHTIAEDLRLGRLVRLLPDIVPLTDTFRLLYRKRSPLAEVLQELAVELRRRPLR